MTNHRALRTLTIVVLIGFGIFLLIASRVHAEQPVRIVVTLTCEDVQALVAWKGWQAVESRARAAGATTAIIDRAKQCLK